MIIPKTDAFVSIFVMAASHLVTRTQMVDAAAAGGDPVRPVIPTDERRAQLIEHARAKIAEIDPENLRPRKFIYVIPGEACMKLDSDLLRELSKKVFVAYTKAGALVAYRDWLDSVRAEFDWQLYENEHCGFMESIQAYVANQFAPSCRHIYLVEVPYELEEVHSLDCAVGPKRAVDETE